MYFMYLLTQSQVDFNYNRLHAPFSAALVCLFLLQLLVVEKQSGTQLVHY